MGRPKPFLPIDGTYYLARILDTLARGGIDDVVVVSNPAHRVLYQNVRLRARRVENPNVDGGMMESLRLGLRHCGAGRHVLVTLVDMPAIAAATITALCAASRSSPNGIIRASHDGISGHPVIYPPELCDALASWEGPDGARGFQARHASLVRDVGVEDPGTLVDTDTPEQYRRLARRGTPAPPENGN